MTARHPRHIREIVGRVYEECADLCVTTEVRALDPVARKFRDKTRRAVRSAIRAAHRRYLAVHVNGHHTNGGE